MMDIGKIRAASLLSLALALAFGTTAAWGDGMIIPVRPDLPVRGTWSVKYHHVKINVQDQVATVSIDQSFVNHGSGDLEVEYLFPVPPEAAISAMTLVVDGKEMIGKLMDAKEAKKIYEDIVRRKKDPALLEYVGYGVYRTRAFPLQPNKPANVVVNYTTVCKKDGDLVEMMYPLNTEKFSAQKIDDVEVTVDIKGNADITAVYSPSHDLAVERKDARHVIGRYHVKDAIPDTDFQVYYKAADEKVGATVLSYRGDKKSDGYYLVLVSPNPKLGESAGSKDVVVVLDHSGSMAQHHKLDQAKEALRYVLGSLATEDRFNVVPFCDSVDTFFNKITDVNDKNRKEAMDLLDRVEPTGGTNIADALTTALGMFEKGAKRPGYVLFLTDGLPTVGTRDEAGISKAVQAANAANVRVFALGVGYDVNVRLLDNVVRENHGVSDYVKEREPLEAKISALYNKIKKPVMTGMKATLEDVKTNMVYPREMGDLFDGGQILQVGRYDKGGKTTLKIAGLLNGKEQVFSYPLTLEEQSESTRNKFVERLWAVRRVGFLLDEIQLRGETKEVTDELIRLSKEYGIMTPYTSFLADDALPAPGSGSGGPAGGVVPVRPATPMIRREAERGLMSKAAGDLKKSSTGGKAQADAMNRQELNYAQRAPAAAGPTPSNTPGWAGQAAGGHDGGAGGGGTALAATQARENRGVGMLGFKDKDSYEQGKRDVVSGVQNVGNQTLFRRGQMWVTNQTEKLDVAKDAAKIKTVDRFSDEYFELVKLNTVDENRVLASQRAGEELLVELRGQAYRIR